MVLTASSTFLVISVSISRVHDSDQHGGNVDLGEKIDAQAEVAEGADHHQRKNQHGRENGAANAKLGECMHGLPNHLLKNYCTLEYH
jgi:hypothetical protein